MIPTSCCECIESGFDVFLLAFLPNGDHQNCGKHRQEIIHCVAPLAGKRLWLTSNECPMIILSGISRVNRLKRWVSLAASVNRFTNGVFGLGACKTGSPAHKRVRIAVHRTIRRQLIWPVDQVSFCHYFLVIRNFHAYVRTANSAFCSFCTCGVRSNLFTLIVI